jgi:hypothetical protein
MCVMVVVVLPGISRRCNAPKRLFVLWKMFLARRMPCRKNFAIPQGDKLHFPMDLSGVSAAKTYLLATYRTATGLFYFYQLAQIGSLSREAAFQA